MLLKINRNYFYNKTGNILITLTFLTLYLLIVSCTNRAFSEASIKERQWAEKTALEIISKIRKGHPRIFLTPERIPELIKQGNSSKKTVLDLMKIRTKGPQAALFYALNAPASFNLSKSREEYGRMAAEFLMHLIKENSPRTSPDDLAILYDWAFDALTYEEKNAFVNFCKKRIGKSIRIHNGKTHGYRASPQPEGIIAALAFYGDGIDDAYAKDILLQGIRDVLLDNLAMEHVAGKDGGFADGTSYIVSLGGTFKTFLAISTATNTDFFFEHEALSKIPLQLMYAMFPFRLGRITDRDIGPYFVNFHDHWTFTMQDRPYGSSGVTLANYIAIISAEYKRAGDEKKAALYTWLLKEAFGGISRQGENPLSFVLMDWTIQPKSPAELGLPLAEALGWNEEKGEIDRDRFGKKAGIGWVSMRSSWNDPDATFAIFKAEPFYYHGHMHHDSLAFMIAKGEELTLARAGNYMCWYEGGNVKSKNPGWPQMGNFFSRTISTNNLLVYDPQEDFGEWTNDGGQRLTPYWDKEWGRTYNGTANGNYRDIGGLIHFERDDKYIYTAADATRAYNSTLITTDKNRPKVGLVQREFVYLRSSDGNDDYFVVFDRVESVKPDFKKLWLLQLRVKPEFNGRHRVTVGNEDGGIHLSEDTSQFVVRQEKATMYGNILLPKKDNITVRRLGGWMTTILKQPLKTNDNGPIDILVESTEGLPNHPVVIITDQEPDPQREVFDKFNVWPRAVHANTKPEGRRIAYFCDSKTPAGQKPAKLLGCIRAIKSAPGFDMPAGARVIQEFRHMGIEGIDKGNDSERIDYPWGYGLGYNYGDGNQYGLWRIEVSPKKPSKYNMFFHILHPSIGKKVTMDAELIESFSGNIYGALVGSKAVIFSQRPESIVKGSYQINKSGKIWQLICNLKPEKRYQVKQEGKVLFELKASKQGTIQFESVIQTDKSRFELVLAE